MKHKWSVLASICIIVSLIPMFLPSRPKLISNITMLNQSYLTILVDKRELGNVEKLEKKLVNMWKEDSFEGMKLHTGEREFAEKLHITVYAGKKALKNGMVSYYFTYEAGD